MTSAGVWTGEPLTASSTSPRAIPAEAAALPAATSAAVTPSARFDQSTPSSTSCQREYIATLATPSATSSVTIVTANTERPQTSQRASIASSVFRSVSVIGRMLERKPYTPALPQG